MEITATQYDSPTLHLPADFIANLAFFFSFSQHAVVDVFFCFFLMDKGKILFAKTPGYVWTKPQAFIEFVLN